MLKSSSSGLGCSAVVLYHKSYHLELELKNNFQWSKSMVVIMMEFAI